MNEIPIQIKIYNDPTLMPDYLREQVEKLGKFKLQLNIADDKQFHFLAMQQNQLVGYLKARFSETAFLDYVVRNDKMPQLGIASRLYKEFEKKAGNLPQNLVVPKANDVAIKRYEKWGFRKSLWRFSKFVRMNKNTNSWFSFFF